MNVPEVGTVENHRQKHLKTLHENDERGQYVGKNVKTIIECECTQDDYEENSITFGDCLTIHKRTFRMRKVLVAFEPDLMFK